MRLYLFEHCSICFRVRMVAALKRLRLQETVVPEDDSDTMIHLVGKRVVPILVKDDGRPMLESMDMVGYIDGLGDPVLTGPERSEIDAWADAIAAKTVPPDLAALSTAWPAGVWHGRRARPLHRTQAQAAWRFRRTPGEDP